MGILNTQLGILYPIGYFLLLVLYYNRHSYCHNHWSVTAFEYFSEWLVKLVYSKCLIKV